MTTATVSVPASECMNAWFAPVMSPRPMRTADTVTPPTTVSMTKALSTITNGHTRLIAPSASVPMPCPTKMPSMIVKRK